MLLQLIQTPEQQRWTAKLQGSPPSENLPKRQCGSGLDQNDNSKQPTQRVPCDIRFTFLQKRVYILDLE